MLFLARPHPNISVNTDRCKRRFAPHAAAGYFNLQGLPALASGF